MALVSDRCICLRKFEYSETSQILTLFAREHGLLRVIAKGAHRKTKAGASKFGGGIDLLDTGNAVFTHAPERDLATLTEWQLLDGHLELRKNLRSVYAGLFCAELLTTLFEEHDPQQARIDLQPIGGDAFAVAADDAAACGREEETRVGERRAAGDAGFQLGQVTGLT